MMNEEYCPLTIESQFASFRDIDPIYKHLFAIWQTAKDDLSGILRNINLVFPHYSLHDASHATTIIHRVEAVLGEERIKKLKPTEIWLFLMSAYTHDIGMLISDDEEHALWKEPQFTSYLHSLADEHSNSDLKEYATLVLDKSENRKENDWAVSLKWAVIVLTADFIRKFHPARSKELINGSHQDYHTVSFDFTFHHFIHERLLNLLGEINALHGRDFSDIFSLDYCCQGMGLADDLVYPRRIAAMLRLGDLLDMDNHRFDSNACPLNGKGPESTMFHMEKEAALRHFLVNKNCIEASFNCPDEGSYEAASSWMTWLKQETENLALHWNDIVPENFGSAPVLKTSKITLNGLSLKGDALRRFDFNSKSVFELMEGANIYKNQFSCLRELVQNAEDATKARFWEDFQSGEIKPIHLIKNLKQLVPSDISKEDYDKYKIQVNIAYDSVKKLYSISVKDRGIGITDKRLEQMEKVASSWQKRNENKKEYEKMPAWLQPTAAFGLGLQSVFRLTDILTCDTAPRREAPKHIVFRSQHRGGRVSSVNLKSDTFIPDGTTFSFSFDDSAFAHFSYHMGGVFESKLDDYDPFVQSDWNETSHLNLFYLLECLYDEVNRGLFPIQVVLKDKESSITLEIPAADDFKKLKFRESDDLSFAYEPQQNEFIAYNRKKHISYVFRYSVELMRHHSFNFIFKGMNVDPKNLGLVIGDPYDGMIWATIRLDGFSTHEWLTLNREEIRQEKFPTLREIIRNDFFAILKIIYQEIADKEFEYWSQIGPKGQLALLSMTDIFEKKFIVDNELIKNVRKILCDKLEEINVPRLLDSNLEKINLTWTRLMQMIREENEFWTYDFGQIYQDPFQNESQNREKLRSIIEQAQLKEKISKKCNLLIPCELYYALFSDADTQVLEMYGKENEARIYRQRWKSGGANLIALEVQSNIRDEINGQLLTHPRMITCAIKDYEQLAVKEVPGWLLSFSHCKMFNYRRRAPLMITPFAKEDIARIIEGSYDAIKIWKKIQNREDFRRLIAFVKEKNIDRNVSEEDIIDTYRKWIGDIIGQCQSKNPKTSENVENK